MMSKFHDVSVKDYVSDWISEPPSGLSAVELYKMFSSLHYPLNSPSFNLRCKINNPR